MQTFFVRCDKLSRQSGDTVGFFSFLPVRTGVDPGRLKHTHAQTMTRGEEEEKILLLGPLAHWFDSNCTVTRFTRQKEKEGNGQAKKEIRYTISRAATPRFVQRF